MSLCVLILGGTTEARQLAARLAARDLGSGAEFDVTLSLAGRTAEPAPQPVPVRVGGFGGAEGLAAHLRVAGIDLLVDATHPHAARISANAAAAARIAGVRLLALRRPPWRPVAGDRWTESAGVAEALAALGSAHRRVFAALGRQELAPLGSCPQHFYLIRSVDPVDPKPDLPNARYITGRGPFEEDAERRLLAYHSIEAILAKNSGGPASYAKIGAARALGIEVHLVRRPEKPGAETVETVEDAVAWIGHLAEHTA